MVSRLSPRAPSSELIFSLTSSCHDGGGIGDSGEDGCDSVFSLWVEVLVELECSREDDDDDDLVEGGG